MFQILVIIHLVLVQICLSTNPNAKGPTFPHIDQIIRPQANAATQEAAVRKMILRIIPEVASKISVYVDPQKLASNSTMSMTLDSFIISSSDGRLQITGTSGFAVAWGLNHFLKTYCGCMITWAGRQLKLPETFPDVAPLKISSSRKVRYYQNPCTPSYSFAFWAWPRWEEELDWMALNGINLPLAFNGQEAVWKRIWLKEGIKSKELDAFFAGPAFLAWGRFGNLHGWGGPLSDSWHANQLQLQKKILQRMHEFGMTPVLPGFDGSVPKAFKRIHPNAKVNLVTWFLPNPQYDGAYHLQPDDPLFVEIGHKFVLEMIKMFDYTGHIYNVNTYNEGSPISFNPKYLAEAAKAVQKGLQAADPEAIWLLGNWGIKQWSVESAKAYVTAIPKERLINLDLRGPGLPQFPRLSSYFGYPFIFGMLQNFGGENSLFGYLPELNEKVIAAYNNEETAYSLIGTGINPEGIDQSEMQFELMNEFGWRRKKVDLKVWTENFYQRRYGIGSNFFLDKGWKFLLHSVYSNTARGYVMQNYVRFRPGSMTYMDRQNYNKSLVSSAWTMFTKAAQTKPSLASSVLFRYDLVDVTREAMGVGCQVLNRHIVDAHKAKSIPKVKAAGKKMVELLLDLDKVLGSDGHFLLGKWINDARKIGTNEEEKKLLEFNARAQVTTWGSELMELNDYAAKQWAGLMKDYYAKRFTFWVKKLSESLAHKRKFNKGQFDKDCFDQIEKPFTLSNKKYATKPVGDSIELAKQMRIKWQHVLFKETS